MKLTYTGHNAFVVDRPMLPEEINVGLPREVRTVEVDSPSAALGMLQGNGGDFVSLEDDDGVIAATMSELRALVASAAAKH